MPFRHRHHADERQDEAVAPPPAAPAAAAPPPPAELDTIVELTKLKDQLEAGTLTQAEFDARTGD